MPLSAELVDCTIPFDQCPGYSLDACKYLRGVVHAFYLSVAVSMEELPCVLCIDSLVLAAWGGVPKTLYQASPHPYSDMSINSIRSRVLRA